MIYSGSVQLLCSLRSDRVDPTRIPQSGKKSCFFFHLGIKVLFSDCNGGGGGGLTEPSLPQKYGLLYAFFIFPISVADTVNFLL